MFMYILYEYVFIMYVTQYMCKSNQFFQIM